MWWVDAVFQGVYWVCFAVGFLSLFTVLALAFIGRKG